MRNGYGTENWGHDNINSRFRHIPEVSLFSKNEAFAQRRPHCFVIGRRTSVHYVRLENNVGLTLVISFIPFWWKFCFPSRRVSTISYFSEQKKREINCTKIICYIFDLLERKKERENTHIYIWQKEIFHLLNSNYYLFFIYIELFYSTRN